MRSLHTHSARSVFAAVCGMILLASCGGSPKSTTPVPQTITVGAIPAFTGFITELTLGSVYVTTANSGMTAGDDVANNQIRGFIRFDLSGVPPGASVQNATLRATQDTPTGTPYADLLTNLRVDHVDLGAALEGAADFSGGTLFVNVGTLSTDAVLESKMLSVGPQVALDLAQGRVTSDFRFAFAIPTDNSGDVDLATFIAAAFTGGPTLQLDLLVPPP